MVLLLLSCHLNYHHKFDAATNFAGIPRIFSDERISDTSNLMNQLSNPEDIYYAEYIGTSRININIRQVF